MATGNGGDDPNTTTDHELVRKLIEEEGGYPAHLADSESEGDQGLLRIGSSRGDPDESLKEISWEEFFEEFDEKDLMLVYGGEGDDRGDANTLDLRDRSGK